MSAEPLIKVTMLMPGVCQIKLNRAEKRNALDSELIREWTQALQQCEANPAIRVVIFSGQGEHFSAGADLQWMQKMAELPYPENVADALILAQLLKTIAHFPKPTLALVQGAVMGGALGVLAACDIAIAADNAVFCFSEVKIGLTPSMISPYVIPVMGERAAKYYFLTAEKFNAETALKLNLVQQITTKDNLAQQGMACAEQLLKNGPHALIEVKKIIRHVVQETYSDQLIQYTAEHLATLRATKEAREGLHAFLEKREPLWK